MSASKSAAGDLVALSLSGLCFVHCLLLPPLAVALPLMSAVTHAEWVHWLFALSAAPISWAALRHARAGARRAALVGVLLLIFGALHWPGDVAGVVATLAGGALIAAAHVLNLLRRQPPCPEVV